MPALTDEVIEVNILGKCLASTVLLIRALGGSWDKADLSQLPEWKLRRCSHGQRDSGRFLCKYKLLRKQVARLWQKCVRTLSVLAVGVSFERKADAPSYWK